MSSVKQFLTNNKFNISILLIYFIIVLYTVFTHELWRDEAQMWCIARDLNIIDILKAARGDGHPFLWYFLLFPFAKSGFPVIVMQLLSFFFVFLSVIFLTFKSPFNRLEKILIISTAGMTYFLPVIARNYSLMPLFIFLLAYYYDKRDNYPYKYSFSLILLSQTHIIAEGFCFILFFCFLAENITKKIRWSKMLFLLPLILNFFILTLTFYNAAKDNMVVKAYNSLHLTFIDVFQGFNEIFCSLIDYKFFAILTLIAGFYITKFDKKLGIIFFTNIGYMLYIYYKIWFGGIVYQKAFMLYLVLIFCIWIIKSRSQNTKPCLANNIFNVLIYIILLISIIKTPNAIINEIKYSSSGSKEIAHYIKSNLKNEETFYIFGNSYEIAAIAAYLPKHYFFDPVNNLYITYFNYGSAEKKDYKKSNNVKYCIIQQDTDLADIKYKLRKVYSSKRKLNPIFDNFGEIFDIYEKE